VPAAGGKIKTARGECVRVSVVAISQRTNSLSLSAFPRGLLSNHWCGRLILQAKLSTYSWWTHFIIQHFNIEQPRGTGRNATQPQDHLHYSSSFLWCHMLAQDIFMGARPGHSWSKNLVWRLLLKLPANMLLCKCAKLPVDCIMRNLMYTDNCGPWVFHFRFNFFHILLQGLLNMHFYAQKSKSL
jgi:hypothetical protein